MKKKSEEQIINHTKSTNPERLLKQTREKLIKSEEKLRDTLNNLDEAYFSTALDGTLLEHNQALNRILGFDVKKDLKGFHIPDLWESKKDRQEYLKNLLAKDSISKYEIKAKTKQGKVIILLASAHLVKDELNRPQRIEGIFWDVTDNKCMEDALRASEEKYRLLADNVTDGIFTMDMNFKYTYASLSAHNIVGYTADELLTMRADQLVDTETFNWFTEVFAEELAIEKKPDRDLKRSRVLEYQHIRKDGSKVWVEAKLTFLRDKKNTAIGIQGIVRDINERKKAEAKLRREEQLFRSVAEQSSDVIVIADLEAKITYQNPAIEKALGYKVGERYGHSGFDLVHPDDFQNVMVAYKILFSDAKAPAQKGEVRFRHKDGSWKTFEIEGSNLVHDNVIEAAIVNMHDITERKKAEEELKKSESFFKEISENSSDIIVITDQKGYIKYCSLSFERFTGYRVEEAMGKNTSTFIYPDDIQKAIDVFTEAVRSKAKAIPHELRLIHKNGSVRYFAGTGRFLLDNPYISGIIMNINDVTERKKAEETLRQSEEKYRSILENMQEGYFEIDLAGNFTFVNDSTCRDMGYSKEELMGMNNRQYTDKENAKKLFQAFHKVYKTGEPLKEFRWEIIRKDGTKQYTEGSISLKRDTSGKPVGFTGVAHDITERARAEETIRQSEEKYRLLADHMKDYVWLMDFNLKVFYISPSVEKLMGYNLEDFKLLPLDKILTTASFETAMEFMSAELPKALAAPPDYVLERSLELEFCCKDGRAVWGECYFTLIRDDKGTPLQLLGVSRNITERKQVEDALKRSEENFRRSLDDSPLGVRISTVAGKTIYANRAILDMYGYDSVEELENTPLRERYTLDTYNDFLIRKQKRLQGELGPSEYEVSIITKSGDIRHLHVFRKEIFWNGEKQSQVIYEDITLRRQAEEKLNETLENLRQSIKITIQVLGTASEAKDPYMAGHQRRVADLARAIATEMKLPHEKIEAIRMASAIHDIGKISVPAEILCKPAILTELEFSLIKNHPGYSYDIIKEVESPWPLADIVHQHHERIDGSGYPKGLKNGDILIESRILAVADVVEAMMSYRPYRPALGLEIALAEIENNAGILYDRDVVNACLHIFRTKNYHIS